MPIEVNNAVSPSTAERQRRYLVPGACLAGLVLYAATCSPGVVWQDGAMFQYRIWQGDIRGELGLPLAHPLYIVLARAFTLALPFGEFAFRVNLFSAVCAAACLGLAMELLISLTKSRVAAVTGTVVLAVSHTFWMHAVVAEVYSLYALALLAELVLLERFFRRRQSRWLIAAVLVNGLSVSNHLLALLHAPAYAGVVIWGLRAKRIRLTELPILAGAFLLGAAPYLALVFDTIGEGMPVVQSLKEALVGPPHRAAKVLAVAFPFARQAIRSLAYFALNFPTPLAVLCPVGVWLAWRERRLRWFLAVAGSILVLDFVFAFRYLVPDQYVFFMPCYVVASLLVGLGVVHVAGSSAGRRAACLLLAALPVVVYEVAPTWRVPFDARRDIPAVFRNADAYFLRPRKNGDDGAERFARAALARAEPDGLLIADATIKNVLVYVRDVQGIGRDVTLARGPDTTPAEPVVPLTPEAVAPFAELGVAYVCSDQPRYIPSWIPEQYTLVADRPVFQLLPRPPSSQPQTR